GQVRHVPVFLGDVNTRLLGPFFLSGKALLDGVLVGAGEGRVDQVPAVGVARGHRQLRAVLHDAADLVDVGEVDLWVHPLAEQVQPQGDQADVTGAFTVSEQASLDPVGPGHHPQLRRGHTGATVVVRVHRQGHVFAASQVAAHPLVIVRVYVWCGDFDI